MNIIWGYSLVKWPDWHKWHISDWKGRGVQKFLIFHLDKTAFSPFYFKIFDGDGTGLVKIGILYKHQAETSWFWSKKQKPSDSCFSLFRHLKETNLGLNIELIKRKSVKVKVFSFFLPGTVSSYPTQISLCLVLVDLKIQICSLPTSYLFSIFIALC